MSPYCSLDSAAARAGKKAGSVSEAAAGVRSLDMGTVVFLFALLSASAGVALATLALELVLGIRTNQLGSDDGRRAHFLEQLRSSIEKEIACVKDSKVRKGLEKDIIETTRESLKAAT